MSDNEEIKISDEKSINKENNLTNRRKSDNYSEIDKKIKSIRKRERIPLSEQNRLLRCNQKDGFTYRMVTDKWDRIPRFEKAGWTIVDRSGDEIYPDERIQDPSWDQRALSQPVGGGLIGYMMCIPTEIYDEDVKKRQNLIDEGEKVINSSKISSYDNSINVNEVKLDQSFYTNNKKIKMRQ